MFDTSLHLLKGIDGRGCFDIDLKYLKLNCDIVRMILSGDKTQIRVLVKQANSQDEDPADQYEAGDVIAVKETWAVKDGKYIYKADYDNNYSNALWVQSTRMPDDAVRLFLRVVSVRKEKLQDISSEDMEKEGVWFPGTLDPQNEFAAMWNESLSPRKKERYSWSSNPTVWVIDFERVSNSEVAT